MTPEEQKICDLERDNAVLKERMRRLETIVYTTIGFAGLQLLGLFFMWITRINK